MTTKNAAQTTAKLNNVSSFHTYRAYITGVELVVPKPEQGQKKEPKPYYTVRATLHNGKGSDKKLKYIYANSLFLTNEMVDIIEDVYLQFQENQTGEKMSVPCAIDVVNLTAQPYVYKGSQLRVNWGGTINSISLSDEALNTGDAP